MIVALGDILIRIKGPAATLPQRGRFLKIVPPVQSMRRRRRGRTRIGEQPGVWGAAVREVRPSQPRKMVLLLSSPRREYLEVRIGRRDALKLLALHARRFVLPYLKD